MDNEGMLAILIFGYVLSFALPAIALTSVYWRARKKKNDYRNNLCKRAEINARFPRLQQLDDLLARSGNPQEELGISKSELYVEQAELKSKRAKVYRSEGVRYLSVGRVDEEMEDVFDGKLVDTYYLALRDFWFVGIGLLIGSATSIVALFQA